MLSEPLQDDRRGRSSRQATVEIVVPVYNEERSLARSVRTLRSYLDQEFPFAATVTIADNASTDGTWDIASRLAAQLPGVRALHLDRKGRGNALKVAWGQSTADVVAYMDVDLATDLDAILPLVAPLVSGHSDIAIGSRLARGARVVRGPRREVISRAYNLILRATVRNQFTDAQCGFKALRADAARELLPLVEDGGWFFDTEMLVLAEHNGLRIHEVAVDWVDDPDSRVDVVATAVGDLRGLVRVSRRLAAGRGRTGRQPRSALEAGTRFAQIGGLSTLAYLVIYLALQAPLGSLAANAVALTSCALANFAAHRRYTLPDQAGFGRGDRFAAASAVAWAAALTLTTVALAVSALFSTSVLASLLAVVCANGVVSVGRFVAVRAVLFRRHLDTLSLRGRPGAPARRR
ncbi:bifunctional glycosyltransferase family 2/GtrA family protein [Acidiferrimicrobium sp. IK]|uniref:bifunctional glycosyltransferase family 2/GtrA family protein n=1 Tax=Acidiferrimicrobium sp. IK TaxID=2871700 RepID=UPI0021CB8FA2|nr:bifunctional glycosyltransferase family 2/GtrA family protein [Acidiferrimicrobium sp. IK]MCU4184112.1 bifunctional glycosyltransferase family 2/GtrA family protein [Acidiferrimicrobium sp. IK]